MNLFEMEPEKYYDVPASQPAAKKEMFLERAIESGNYVCSEKFDGNWARFVLQDGVAKIQSRGRSVRGGFGEFQEKVPHIFNALKKIFSKDTLIIGELYLPGGNDKDVGSILRCLPAKALARQEKGQYLHFKIFDVWFLDGLNYMNMPLYKRIHMGLKRIEELTVNLKYISVVQYFPIEDMYELLDNVFSHGGEGIVIQDINGLPEPGKRPAWKSLKIKKEIYQDVDVFCSGFEPPTRDYTGEYIENWMYWENVKSGEKVYGKMYEFYIDGKTTYEPVTKNYFNGWPGSILCSVLKDNQEVQVCKVSGITEDIKEDIKNNPTSYLHKPMRITGMEFSTNQKNDELSIRHPKFISFREDISYRDCTYDKLFGQ